MGTLRTLLLLSLVALLATACEDDPSPVVDETPALPALPSTPNFDPDSAYQFIQQQVDFGPRVPGFDAHKACGDWMVAKARSYGAQVVEQTGKVTAFNGKVLPLRNIIASWQPENKRRILLFAHWDTRPFADQDETRTNEPIAGANDGGSGVGVLLELARHLKNAKLTHGIDIIFFDVEDYGRPSGSLISDGMESWCLGSQYWTKNLHTPNYKAKYGILLDMCGAAGAEFHQEAISMQYAPQLMRRVWRTGHALGYGRHFVEEPRYYVGVDDHKIVNEVLGIPSIDIIEYNSDGGVDGGFHPSWHTHEDDMDIIDKATLKAVGQTVMHTVWQER